MEVELRDMRHGYVDLCRRVLDRGQCVEVRGQMTKELLDVTFRLDNPRDSLPFGVNRAGLKPAIGALEALQLIGGVSHPELMIRVAGRFMSTVQDGGSFHGAYGPRTRSQLPAVVQRLRDDPQTRQAIVTVWDPQHDLFIPDVKDYPCTVMLQFLIRDGALQLHTKMRSNDVWLGLAYDCFQFTQLQMTVANVLDIPYGPYYHHATSFHAYERDWRKMELLDLSAETDVDALMPPPGLFGASWGRVAEHARYLLRGNIGLDQSGGWYSDALEPLFPVDPF